MILPQFYTDDIIKRAILEDINYVDVASDYLISGRRRSLRHRCRNESF